jgi:hypothetical protein
MMKEAVIARNKISKIIFKLYSYVEKEIEI